MQLIDMDLAAAYRILIRMKVREILALLILVTCAQLACKPTHVDTLTLQQTIAESERLSLEYLNGDVAAARAALNADAKLLELSTTLEPIGRAQLLSLVHCNIGI